MHVLMATLMYGSGHPYVQVSGSYQPDDDDQPDQQPNVTITTGASPQLKPVCNLLSSQANQLF